MTIPEAYACFAREIEVPDDTRKLLNDARRAWADAENPRRREAAAIVNQHVSHVMGTRRDVPEWQDAAQELLRKLARSGPRPWMRLCDEQTLTVYVLTSLKRNFLSSLVEDAPSEAASLHASVPDPVRDGIDAAKPEVVAVVSPWVASSIADESLRLRYGASLMELHAIKQGAFTFEALVPHHADPAERVEHPQTKKTVEDRLYQRHKRAMGQLIEGTKFYGENRALDGFRRQCLLQAVGELFQRKFGDAEIVKYTRPLSDADRIRWKRRAAAAGAHLAE